MSDNYNEADVKQWLDATVIPTNTNEEEDSIPLHQPSYNDNIEIPETPPRSNKRLVIKCYGQRIETNATIPITEDDRGSDKTEIIPGPSSSSSTEDIFELTDNNNAITTEPKQEEEKEQEKEKVGGGGRVHRPVRDPQNKAFVTATRDLQRRERDWRQRWQWDEQDERTKIFRTKRDREENLILEQRQTNRRVAELTADIARMHKRRMLKLGNSADKAIVIV